MLTTHATCWESGRWKAPEPKRFFPRAHEFPCPGAKPRVRAAAGAQGWCWHGRCLVPPVPSLHPRGRDPTTVPASSQKGLSWGLAGVCGAALAGIWVLWLSAAPSLSSTGFGRARGECSTLGAWCLLNAAVGRELLPL